MKVYKLLFLSLFISSKVFAFLEGDYQKSQGPTTCPEGRVYFKEIKEDKQKVLIFGAKHSWVFDLDSKINKVSELSDKSNCSYEYTYALSDNNLNYKTNRFNCPTNNENAQIEEVFHLKDGLLTYSFKTISSKKAPEGFECHYKKKK